MDSVKKNSVDNKEELESLLFQMREEGSGTTRLQWFCMVLFVSDLICGLVAPQIKAWYGAIPVLFTFVVYLLSLANQRAKLVTINTLLELGRRMS